MRRPPRGPRRAASVESYLRQTRFIALLALVAFVAGVVSDFTSGNFWGRHALLASLAGSGAIPFTGRCRNICRARRSFTKRAMFARAAAAHISQNWARTSPRCWRKFRPGIR